MHTCLLQISGFEMYFVHNKAKRSIAISTVETQLTRNVLTTNFSDQLDRIYLKFSILLFLYFRSTLEKDSFKMFIRPIELILKTQGDKIDWEVF